MNRLSQLMLGLGLSFMLAILVISVVNSANYVVPILSTADSKQDDATGLHDWDDTSFADRPMDRNLYHLINQRTIFAGNACTSTAIFPHALLTDSHCEQATDELLMDGYPVHIAGRIRDSHDHSIYLLSDVTFASYAKLAFNDLHKGEAVHFFGIASWRDPLRRGHFRRYVSQSTFYPQGWGFESTHDKRDVEQFAMLAIPGDSGSGVMNDKGELVAVISTSNEQGICSAFPLAFTTQQLKEAESYAPPSTNRKIDVPVGRDSVISIALPDHMAAKKDHNRHSDRTNGRRPGYKGYI